MRGHKAWLFGGLIGGAVVAIAMVLMASGAQTPEEVAHAAVEAFRQDRFDAFRPYTPAGLSSSARLRLLCGDAPSPACRTRHQQVMARQPAEVARFEAAFAESAARAKAARFDWTQAVIDSVDTSGLTEHANPGANGVQTSGRIRVHGRSGAGAGFVLELTGCARMAGQDWLCAIPRWLPANESETE